MATVRVKVKSSKAYSRIPSIIGQIKAETAQMAYNFVRRAASLARSFAPIRTGFLKSSVQTIKIAKGWRLLVGADYGAYVNYGTRHMAPQPFYDQAIAMALMELRAK